MSDMPGRTDVPGAVGAAAHAARLRVDWPACRARGLCAELLPEVVSVDEWGYPVVERPVPRRLLALAAEAVDACPHRALRLLDPPRPH
jgi:ferredoxin